MRSRLWMLCCITLALVVAATGRSHEGQVDQTDAVITAFKDKAEDPKQLNQALGAVFQRVSSVMQTDPAAAETLLDQLDDALSELGPEDAEATRLVARGKAAVNRYRQRLDLARTSVEELRANLQENADDANALSQLTSKYQQQIGSIARSSPEDAEQQLNEAKSFLASIKEKATQNSTKYRVDRSLSTIARLDRTIQSTKKLLAMIGKEAAPLDVEAWVNGQPVSDSDLKGKVVLLDFWAVWCGPCIATFPHLREWHEKYSDRGLEIIGVTRYYGYEWDAEAGKAKRSKEVPPEQEREMLAKFAEQHELHHRFAVMADRSLSEYYGVSGIPHVVVIDDSSIIRMMRVGSGETNALDIEELLEEMLGDAKN